MDDPEFLRLQLQQAIETYRSQYGLMVQIGTLLIMADAAVIWHAITSKFWKCRCVWFLGAGLAAAAIVAVLTTALLMKPVAYTAVSIEQKYRLSAPQTPAALSAPYDGLASMFFSTTYGAQGFIKNLEKTANVAGLDERQAELVRLAPPYRFWTFVWSWTGMVLFQLSLAQLLVGCIGPPWFAPWEWFKWTWWRKGLAAGFVVILLVMLVCRL